jgi:hypothetical protein
MKPNDENGRLPTSERPFRMLLISGSDRRQYNCPGVDSKSRTLMLRMADRLPRDWEIDLEDLGNVYGRAKIQSCNTCVSTSMALCCWPCNCYEKGNKDEPDLMWDLDLYARLDLADAWADVKLKWREVRLRLGIPPRGSSPARQQELGLNRDTTLSPKASARDAVNRDGGA